VATKLFFCVRRQAGSQLRIFGSPRNQTLGGASATAGISVTSNKWPIPAEEVARRERMREVTEGVTGYSTDKDFTKITFALDGELFMQNLPPQFDSTIESPTALHAGGGCIDPRLSPDGSQIAFVQAGSLLAVNSNTQKSDTTVWARRK